MEIAVCRNNSNCSFNSSLWQYNRPIYAERAAPCRPAPQVCEQREFEGWASIIHEPRSFMASWFMHVS